MIIIVTLTLSYLFLYPVPIEPEAWKPANDPGLNGPFTKNSFLDEVQVLGINSCHECEDVVVDSMGRIFAGDAEGNILKYDSTSEAFIPLVNTNGRPLGLALDRAGNIYVADAYTGLLKIDQNGELSVIIDGYMQKKFKFLDDLVVSPDNKVYFTEASAKFSLHEDRLDIVEHGPNGRLYVHDLETSETKLLLDSLYFANGITLSSNDEYLLVSNMNKYQIIKYYLKGKNKGQKEVLIENLPGFPDGVNLSRDGIVWVSIPALRVEMLDSTLPYPLIRKIVTRLPMASDEIDRPGMILGFDLNGNLIYNLQGDKFKGITNTVPTRYGLLLGSISEDGIGLMDDTGSFLSRKL